jgi:biopolymer transport protein ExbB
MLAGVMGVLAKGGLVMIPLGACSVLALAVVIERAVAWLRLGSLADSDGVLARAASGKWEDAISAGERSRSPVARVLAAGIRHRNPAAPGHGSCRPGRAGAHAALSPVLDTVITLSPLLAPGTVTGMIRAGIMAQAGLNQPTAITGGVAEALIATAAGWAWPSSRSSPQLLPAPRRGHGGDDRALRLEAGTAPRRGRLAVGEAR